MELLDCGDHSCQFARDTSGMRTNGGCRCLKAIDSDLRSKINYTFHKLRSDHEALKMSLESIMRMEEQKRQEHAAAILQNSELQKEVERCKEIAERDGIDYSDAMLLVSELKTALENSRALVEANRLAIEMLEQEGIRVDGERDNLLRLINEVAELAEHYTGSFWLEETNVAAKKILDVLRPEVKRKCVKCGAETGLGDPRCMQCLYELNK